jgi:hypothetical protein
VTREELDALKEAVYTHHAKLANSKPWSQLQREHCVCGYPTGPGTPACYALSKVLASSACLAEREQQPPSANVWQDDDACDVTEAPPRGRVAAKSVPAGRMR